MKMILLSTLVLSIVCPGISDTSKPDPLRVRFDTIGEVIRPVS